VRVGVFPGSFDPLTIAHLAVADVAIEACRLDQLDLVISHAALAKEPGGHSPIEARVAAIERAAAGRSALRVRTSGLQLIADLADGYDVCVIGADKWYQLHDLGFYDGSEATRDAALARLPTLAVAPRRGVSIPAADDGLVILRTDAAFHSISSTAVRAGRDEWRA
jgi:nicotinic acid mononucleotide adenylyltransferase